MNKRFLLQIVGLLCVLGTFAYNQGDYVYTPDARFKVVGDNLIKNGSFTNQDVSSADFGWTTNEGGSLSPDNWSIETSQGPNGETVLQSQSAAEGVTMSQAVAFEATKSYVITFKIKGVGTASSSITEGDANYIDVYANIDGSISKTADRFQQVATVETVGTEWQDVAFAFTDTVTGGQAGSIIVSLGRLAAGTQITGFEVRQVDKVYDIRIAQRALAHANLLLASADLPKEGDQLRETVAGIGSILETSDADDIATMEDYMNTLATDLAAFLDANSAEMISYISSGDIAGWPKFNNGDGKTSQGDWVFTSDTPRWGHAQDAVEANYSFPSSYVLGWGNASIVKTGMAAGRYMFTIDAYALKYQKSGSDLYAPDYSVLAEGGYVFVGKDTVKIELDNRVYNTYTVFGDVAEDGALNAGIYFPGFTTGGTFRFMNASLRKIGNTAEEVARAQYVADINAQQVELRKHLDLATEEVASTDYPWGKEDLRDSIAAYEPVYTASLEYVSANGEDLGVTIPDGYDDDLLAAVRSMNSARNNYSSTNAPYTELVAYAVEAKTILDDEDNAGATASTRATLAASIESANALIAAVTATEDSLSFATSLVTLKEAVVNFMMSQASFKNPAEVALNNPNFEKNSGQKSGKCEGWTLTLQSDTKGWWFFGKDEKFESGYKIYVSRGNTAFSQNKALQKVTVTVAGLYEFRTQAYATNTGASNYNGMWNGKSGEDSARVSGIALFFGPENAPDSIANVCTAQTTFGNNVWDPDEMRTYSIFYNKKTDGEEVLELGMDALQNGIPMSKGCNIYAFGSNHIYFYGDSTKYATGIEEIPSVVPVTNNDTAVYTFTGVKVGNSTANLPKGIYISRGKKFVVK